MAVGGQGVNFERLQSQALSASEFQRGNAQRTALDRLRLLLGRAAQFTDTQKRRDLFGGTPDSTPFGADKFFQRQREGTETLKLRQFLGGKVPNATPRSVQGIQNFGSQFNTEPVPQQGRERRDLFRRRIAPGRTF